MMIEGVIFFATFAVVIVGSYRLLRRAGRTPGAAAFGTALVFSGLLVGFWLVGLWLRRYGGDWGWAVYGLPVVVFLAWQALKRRAEK